MVSEPIFAFLDIVGMVAFSVSGAIAGIQKRMDVYGVSLLAIVTAVGGGTIRDFLIGSVPVTALRDPTFIVLPVFVALGTFFLQRFIHKQVQILLIMDAVGIGMFTISGVASGLELNIPVHGAILLGIITSTAGGITRDLLCNEVPLVLRKDIYASASLLGGLLYWAALVPFHVHPDLAALLSTAVIIVIRVLAFQRGWHLPYPHKLLEKTTSRDTPE